jgi:hypothetical protein
LGEQAIGGTTAFDFESRSETHYQLLWRTDNVVFQLLVQDQSGKFTETDIRKLADKMQSHLD